jgi:hypothetical protein
MGRVAIALLSAAVAGLTGCGARTGSPALTPVASAHSLAQIYFWRARPGKLEDYNRYIREVAEPIDQAAQRRGAFVSVTTYISRDSSTAWTHMRVFVLRDSTQLAALSRELESAGIRLEPDSTKRRVRGEYAATLRDRVGAVVVEVLP